MVDHREACRRWHRSRERWWTVVDGDPCGKRWRLGKRRLPASLVDDSGYNRVLEEEESTVVFRVGSDGEGGGRPWRSPTK
jgi:hypothetical protein